MAINREDLLIARGYGQVEPNHLSAQRTGQIYAQLPMGVDQLENGQFAKYNYSANAVNFEGDGEWMLVYNAVKVYDEDEGDADYVMKKPTADNGPVIGVSTDCVPRLFKTNVGDIFTTNAVLKAGLGAGVALYVGAEGYLTTTKPEGYDGMEWQIVKYDNYTTPDGQPAVKIMRTK